MLRVKGFSWLTISWNKMVDRLLFGRQIISSLQSWEVAAMADSSSIM